MNIIDKVLKKLELGKSDHVSKFFKKELKMADRKIDALKHEISTEELSYSQYSQKLEEALEDAKSEENAAWLEVNPEEITNNADRITFRQKYWDRIQKAENDVKRFSEDIKAAKEGFEKTIADLKAKIAYFEKVKSRINDFDGE